MTREATIVAAIPGNRKVTEVSVHPSANRIAYRATSADGLITDVIELDLNTNRPDTIIADTLGLITGPVYSPSGSEVLVAIDQSGTENARRRQIDADVFEISLVTGARRLVTEDKPAGFNDLEPVYDPSGEFIYFSRARNIPGSTPAIFRVPRNGSRASEQVVPEGSGPTVR